METIGIDQHKKTSRYALLNQEGEVIDRRSIASTAEAYRKEFGRFKHGEVKIAVDATGYWFWSVDVLQELGLEVHLANPHKVRLIAESTIKTDTVDATALAQLLRMGWLPESRITSQEMRLLRERLRFRMVLVGIRTSCKLRVHAVLGKCGTPTPDVTDLFGKTGREWLECVALAAEYRDNVDGYLRMIDFINDEIKRVETWLEQRTRQDAATKRLMTIPGIGRFGAALILAEIGDIHFFRTKRHLSSFVGVVPGANNSGDRRRDRGLKKDSNRYIRWLLAEAVTKGLRVVPSWQRLYDRIHAGNDKHKSKARVAVMHKMICAVWRVLTFEEGFNRLHNCPELKRSKASS